MLTLLCLAQEPISSSSHLSCSDLCEMPAQAVFSFQCRAVQMLATMRKPRQLPGPFTTWISSCSTEIAWSSASALRVPSVVQHMGILIGHAGEGTCGQQLSGWGSFARFDAQQTDRRFRVIPIKNDTHQFARTARKQNCKKKKSKQ